MDYCLLHQMNTFGPIFFWFSCMGKKLPFWQFFRILGSYNFLAYLECVRSYAWSKGHWGPDLSSVIWLFVEKDFGSLLESKILPHAKNFNFHKHMQYLAHVDSVLLWCPFDRHQIRSPRFSEIIFQLLSESSRTNSNEKLNINYSDVHGTFCPWDFC